MSVNRVCFECCAPLMPTRPQRLCGKCIGKRIARGKTRGRARRAQGVDIDAVHRNPRWKKIKEAA